MANEIKLGGQFTFPGTPLAVQQIGYGAMQLAGTGVWGPPKDVEGAIAVLREAVAAGELTLTPETITELDGIAGAAPDKNS